MFRFELIAKRFDTYGERVVSTTPTSVLAADLNEAVLKGQAAFNAKYDDFRKFWSHGFELVSVTEPDPPQPVLLPPVVPWGATQPDLESVDSGRNDG